MFNRAPRFTYSELQSIGTDSYADVVLPERPDNPEALQQAAWKNMSLLVEILGNAIRFERRLRSDKALKVHTLRLSSTDDYYSLSVLTREISALSGQVAEERWDYLYYSDPRLANQAQVDITLQNPLAVQFGQTETHDTVSMQRFMTLGDHRYVYQLLRDTEHTMQKSRETPHWDGML